MVMVFLFFFVSIIIFLLFQKNKCPEITCAIDLQNKSQNSNNSVEVIETIDTPKGDPVTNYDRSKLYDPLREPTRRIPRYQLPPYEFKRLIDVPTRGYPDNFILMGILVRHDKLMSDDANKILRLYGREVYPGSSDRYEYYTAVNSGLDQIKIPIHNKGNKELYDDDIVYIDSLDSSYKVKLHKYDAPKYYPDLFY